MLNVDVAAAGGPPAARDKARPAVLQQVIDRKLLVQAAKKDGLDKDPEYLLIRQRADEVLLAQKLLQRGAQSARQTPTSDQVETYLRDHPQIADARQILTIDQVRFPTPTKPEQVKALQGIQSLDQLVGLLKSENLPFDRNTVKADTATLPDQMLTKMNGLKPGEPLIVLGGPVLTAAVITGRESAPLPPEAAADAAKRRIQADTVSARLKQENAALRQDAKIDYAPGMAPRAPKR